MNGFMEWCIIASVIVGFINFAFLVIIDDKLCEIKREISSLKRERWCGVMAEYIEREVLIAEIEENINTYWNEGSGGYYLAEDALNYSIKTAPTADVVEVTHGEWIPIVSYFHGKPDGRYYCSECHRVETMKGFYCRLCGALMDGGKK